MRGDCPWRVDRPATPASGRPADERPVLSGEGRRVARDEPRRVGSEVQIRWHQVWAVVQHGRSARTEVARCRCSRLGWPGESGGISRIAVLEVLPLGLESDLLCDGGRQYAHDGGFESVELRRGDPTCDDDGDQHGGLEAEEEEMV